MSHPTTTNNLPNSSPKTTPTHHADPETVLSSTVTTRQASPHEPTDQDPARHYERDLLASLSAGDKALFDSVVNTLAESDPRVRELNPIDVIMSLNVSSEALSGLLGSSTAGGQGE